MRLSPLDFFLALSVPVIWGMGFVFAKGAIAHFPPILLIALRFTVTALVLIWFVKPPKALFKQIALIALVSATIQYSMTFTALQYLDASTAGIVVQLETPLLVLMGWAILGDKPGLRKLMGIAVSFAGVVLMTGDPKLQAEWFWLAVFIAGLVVWSAGQIMVRRLGEVGGFTLVAWVAAFAAPQLFAASWLFEEDHIRLIAEADWTIWATVLYLGVVMTALGYGLWYHLLGRYPVSQVGPFLLLIPVATLIGGIVILGEEASFEVLLGGAVVVAGVAFILIERRRPIPPPP
ncbi:MAG: EamA family transporter [Marivibrio sp.]|uniref:DMT family transporter n=1 Tax=Marivibrio sp. TaxID=2039719 RepID=UPI0032EF9F9D